MKIFARRELLLALMVAALGRTYVSAQEAPRPGAEKGPALKSKATPNAGARPAKDAKPDVEFVFDFKALNLNSGDAKKDAALKQRCAYFAKITRSEVYPLLREITGVSVGKHYIEIRYQILPPATVGRTIGGCAIDNEIKLDQRYSVDMNPPTDIHEMIHVFNHACGVLHGAVDHVWHGALTDAVEVRLGRKPQYSRDDAVAAMQNGLKQIEASPNAFRSPVTRSGILTEQMTVFYFDLGEEAIGRLYRSTIDPHPVGNPSASMVAKWGKEAEKVQALVETVKRDYKFTFDERTRKALGL
jgi:hypothetical protein